MTHDAESAIERLAIQMALIDALADVQGRDRAYWREMARAAYYLITLPAKPTLAQRLMDASHVLIGRPRMAHGVTPRLLH